MIRISPVLDEKDGRDEARRYVGPACRVYRLRLRSGVLYASGDIEPIGDDDDIPED